MKRKWIRRREENKEFDYGSVGEKITVASFKPVSSVNYERLVAAIRKYYGTPVTNIPNALVKWEQTGNPISVMIVGNTIMFNQLP